MALHCFECLLCGESAVKAECWSVESVEFEVIVVYDAVVPRWAGTVIVSVSAFHIGIARKPCSVVVLTSNPDVGRADGFTFWSDTSAGSTFSD